MTHGIDVVKDGVDAELAAAMQRCIAKLMSPRPLDAGEIAALTLRDLPEGEERTALLRRRFSAGLSMCPNSRLLP